MKFEFRVEEDEEQSRLIYKHLLEQVQDRKARYATTQREYDDWERGNPNMRVKLSQDNLNARTSMMNACYDLAVFILKHNEEGI